MSSNTDLLLPEKYWHLDPVYNSYAKLRVQDILNLHSYPTADEAQSVYSYKGHPVQKVDIVGVVLSIKEKDKLFICHVDDGSGVISCTCWKPKDSLLQDDSRVVQDPKLGDLIQIKGRISSYNCQLRINALYYSVLSDPMEEVFRLAQITHAYQSMYNCPLRLPTKIRQELEDLAEEQVTGIKTKRRVVTKTQEAIELFLHKHKIEEFMIEDLEMTDELYDTARQKYDGATGGERKRLRDVFVKALNNLESEGKIYHSLVKTCIEKYDKKYQVIAYSKKLDVAVLKILTGLKDKNEDYDGVDVYQVHTTVTGDFKLGRISRIAVHQCLKKLESESKLISVSDNRYMYID